MKYLVTGHEGFIGKALFKKLQKISSVNDAVIGLDVSVKSGYDEYCDVLYKIKPDVIFHVGACSNTQEQDINKMMYLNLHLTNAVAEYCRLHGASLIYSSSAACYGLYGLPNTLYGWSKYAGEKVVQNMGGVSLRYFNVYGHDESHKGEMASVAYQAYQKNDFMLFPRAPERDFVYINDVVNANIHACENYENLSGGVYDVGTGESRTFEEVLDMIKGLIYTYHPESAIPKNYQFNTCAKPLKFMDGWYPKYNLEEGMEEYLKILSSSSDNTHKGS
jgi:ADP-L-glycero-D-manno-heptose 6-epimerase